MSKFLGLAIWAIIPAFSSAVWAQNSLTVSSGSVAPDGTVSLTLSFAASSGTSVAALQWTLTYPAGVTNVSVAPGAALTAAGKTVTCAANSSGYICIASGMNANVIGNGVIGSVSARFSGSGSISFGLTGVLGATPDGSAVSLTGAGSTIVTSQQVSANSVTCNPSSLAPGGSTTCTVNLSGPAGTGGATVTLGTAGSISTSAGSLTIPAGSSSGVFTATAGHFTSDQSSTITATLNGSSAPLTIPLVVPALVSALQCTPTTLASNGSSVCTITLSKVAPSGGASVALSGAIANVLSVPASVTVLAGASSATFNATAGSIPADQSATISAALNGSSIPVTFTLSAPVLVSALQCTPATLASNASSACKVTLTKTAPTGGVTVTISGAIANVFSLPASVTVPAGATTAVFNANAGTITTSQTATVTAAYGSGSAQAGISLTAPSGAPVLSSLSCTPLAVPGGGSGSCTVQLQGAVSQPTTIALRSTNTGLFVPASIAIAAGAVSGSFAFTTSSTLTGWIIVVATLGSTTKSVILSLSQTPTSNLVCPPSVQSGSSAICELRLGSSSASASTRRLSSTSPRLKVPAQLTIRPGQYAARFEAATDPSAGSETAVLTVESGAEAVQSTVQIQAPNSPVLNAPDRATAKIGSSVRLHVSASAADGFPVTLSASQVPAAAAFNAQTGDFTWAPTAKDSGAHSLVFTATDSAGVSASKTVSLYVADGTPELTELLNTAGAGAPAACTPGSVATLAGRFLFAGDRPAMDRSGSTLDLQNTQVLVNGSGTPVLFASSDRVDFLCPRSDPGTPLEIVLESGAGRSNPIRATMQADAPGILTVDGENGQALAFPSGSSEIAAIPNPRLPARPAVAGDLLSVLASGVPCDQNFASGKPQLLLGAQMVETRSIRPAPAYAGACELTFEIPAGIAVDNLRIQLQVQHYDRSLATSNAASIAVEDR